jgi:hypothetical protein
MRADTQAISIQASPDVVVDFLGDPRNLPRWAVGFAKSVRQDGARWIVSTARGEVPIRIVSDRRFGVVDFHMSLALGREAVAASRVVPREGGAEYVFTQFQEVDMPDDVFAKSVQALAHELTVLKALLEVECPR